jgi:6-phosphogluconolactonase
MNGEVRLVEDVAGAFVEEVVSAFQARANETFAFALCGGTTGRLCYEALSNTAAQRIDWLDVDFYWGDERCVPPDDPDSNQRLARETLLERVGAANAVYPMRCEEGPEAYQIRLAEVGHIDLLHLGMGPDGHVASLFPDSAALDSGPGVLVSFNSDVHGLNPHRRMTLTFAGIARAQLVVITVTGESKAKALAAVHDGAPLPASRVEAERVLWLVDRAAAPWAV